MTKFNRAGQVTGPKVPGSGKPLITTTQTPTATTFEGGSAFERGAKGELFILAVNNMVEDTFYERGSERDERYRQLVYTVAEEDPEWVVSLIDYLRRTVYLRSVSLMTAAEMARYFQQNPDNGDPHRVQMEHYAVGRSMGPVRRAVNVACQRPDEPGEMLAYWIERYGRRIPKPMKRGLADAARRLYSERSLLKYDTDSHDVRFGDVLELVHPEPDGGKPSQGDLFKYAIDHRHGRADASELNLPMIRFREHFTELAKADSDILLSETKLARAGMTWENALSLAGTVGLPKQKVWEAMIPSMGYMALLRNLRNFDKEGVGDSTVAPVLAKLADPVEVHSSRQMPFRYYTAYRNLESLRWGPMLEKALDLSVSNIPEFSGRSLVLVDMSGSMGAHVSEKSSVKLAEVAALFGAALAGRNPGKVDLVGFAGGAFQHRPFQRGGSVLRYVEGFVNRIGDVGYATNVPAGLAYYSGHDRVFIISDMQTMHYVNVSGRHLPIMGGDVTTGRVPADVPVYTFNLAGYKNTPVRSAPYRHELGGLTDATFKLIPLLELGRDGSDTWPWDE